MDYCLIVEQAERARIGVLQSYRKPLHKNPNNQTGKPAVALENRRKRSTLGVPAGSLKVPLKIKSDIASVVDLVVS